MRIEITGRHVEVTAELREHVHKRLNRISRQVADDALMEVVLSEERNPSIADKQIAEATIHVKGTTLHAHEASPEMIHSIQTMAGDMRRQVKRHKEKGRKRHRTRLLVKQTRRSSAA